MKDFFMWTAWGMTPPQPYGLFHLLFTFIGLAVVITVAYFLRRLSPKANRILLLCIGIFLMVAELYKQLFYYYVVGKESYAWWIFPFQLCSVPMYLCIFCGICRNEKVNSWLYEFMFAFNFFGGMISFVEPSGLNHPYVTLTLHAYIWHMLLIFIGFYLYFSKRACRDWKGYLKGMAVFGVAVVLAQIANVIAQGHGGFNMFYISPYSASPLFFFNEFYTSHGWLANMALYLFALLLAGAIIYYAFYMPRFLINRKKQKLNN